MRPDMDDYAEIDETKPLAGSRAMSWMVLAIAVGGFATLAYFAYHSGANTINADEMMVVEADTTPMKEAPATPDGAEFANQDKTIYDVISPSATSQTAEKLLPEPEQPVALNAAPAAPTQETPAVAAAQAVKEIAPATNVPATTTYVAEPVEAPAKPADTQVAAAATTAALVAAEPATKPVEAAPAKPVEKSFSAPQMVNEKPATKTPATAPEKVKAESKPKAEKVPVKASAGGAYKLQLGAFKSEGEAQAAWKKISAKHSAVLSGAPTIVKAEVNGGTFYRLRAGSFASADEAKAACAKLAGQACFPTK